MTNQNLDSVFHKDTSKLLNDTFNGLIAGLSGIVTSDKKEFFLTIGHLLQRIRAGKFLNTLKDEWNYYKEKGKIKDDYQYTEQHYDCLQEMLEFLDKDIPDEIRFNFLKKIFITTATEKMSSRDSNLPQQYLKIGRQLESGEILILSTEYHYTKENKWPKEDANETSKWFNIITKETGLLYNPLVEIYEESLIKKKLIIDRRISDKSMLTLGKYHRLTELGFAICEYIKFYDKDLNSNKSV